MSTTTQTPKRGRPAGSTNKKPAAPKQSVSTGMTIKREIPTEVTLEYKSLVATGATWLIQQRGITIHDKETDSIREIRYCPSENSIFRDEQSDLSVRKSIVFNEGRIFVRPDQPNLRKYLDAHPGNKVNGGKMFYLVDQKKNSKEKLDKEFVMAEAINMIRTKDLNELLSVAVSYGINIDRAVDEIKHDLMIAAKKSPQKFIEAFDSPTVKMKTKLTLAKKYQIIKFDKEGMKWYDSNKLIVSVPVGKDPIEVGVRYLLTEAATSVVEEIDRQLP